MVENAESNWSKFGIVDYFVFSSVLFLSAAIGFYYAWNERKKKTLDHVLLGGRKLKVGRGYLLVYYDFA